MEAAYRAKEARTEHVRSFSIAPRGGGREIITIGTAYNRTARLSEIRVAWENQLKIFTQPEAVTSGIVWGGDSKAALRQTLAVGLRAVDPAKFGQRWLHSTLKSFSEGVDSGAVMLESELKELEAQKPKEGALA